MFGLVVYVIQSNLISNLVSGVHFFTFLKTAYKILKTNKCFVLQAAKKQYEI